MPIRAFCDRFQTWMGRADETPVSKVLLELGKQLLRPKKKGNASLFWSQVPTKILNSVYSLAASIGKGGCSKAGGSDV